MLTKEIENNDIIKMTGILRKRGKYYFDEGSINLYYLFYFLSGFLSARNFAGIETGSDMKFNLEFNTWIYKKYEHILDHNMFWAKAISIIEKDPEKQADLFFSLFEEFFEVKL